MNTKPTLNMYHANAKRTGSACKVSLTPANGDASGYIEMMVAPQSKIALATYATFDWEEKSVAVKLGFDDLCKIQQVLRGECESADAIHALADGTEWTRINHVLEPESGYTVEIVRTYRADETANKRAFFFLRNGEALGLSEIIAGSMARIAFGD